MVFRVSTTLLLVICPDCPSTCAMEPVSCVNYCSSFNTLLLLYLCVYIISALCNTIFILDFGCSEFYFVMTAALHWHQYPVKSLPTSFCLGFVNDCSLDAEFSRVVSPHTGQLLIASSPFSLFSKPGRSMVPYTTAGEESRCISPMVPASHTTNSLAGPHF